MRNTLLHHYGIVAGVIVNVFKGIPFLKELKVIMDWTFITTSLDVFKWFKIENVHFFLFAAKLETINVKGRRIGDTVGKISKFLMGFLLILVIMILLFGPMLIFSTINPTKISNKVQGGEIKLTIC